MSPVQVTHPHGSCQWMKESIVWRPLAPVVRGGALSPTQMHILEGLFPNKKGIWVLGNQKYSICPLKVVSI